MKYKTAIVIVLILIVGIISYLLSKENKVVGIEKVEQKSFLSEEEARQLAVNYVFDSRKFTTPKECMFAEPYTRFNNAIDFEVRIVKSEMCDKTSSMLLETVRVNLETGTINILAYVDDEQILKVPTYKPAQALNQNFCDLITKIPYTTPLNPPFDWQTATTSGSCKISLNSDTTFIFSFDNISASTTPRFVLNIFNPLNNQVQSIRLAYDWEYNNKVINLHDDINFDGYKDMLIKTFGRRASNFLYYLYDPLSETFVEDEVLSGIYTPTFSSKERTITTTPDVASYYFDDKGEQQYSTPKEETSIYRFVEGKYILSNQE